MSTKTSSAVSVAATIPPAALSTTNAAAYLGVSPGYLRNLRSLGEGPDYRRLSDSPKSAVVYLVRDLDAWLESRRRVTSAGGAA